MDKNDLRCKSRPDLTFLGSFWQKIPGGKAEQLRPEATDALQLELAQEASVRSSNWFFGAKYKWAALYFFGAIGMSASSMQCKWYTKSKLSWELPQRKTGAEAFEQSSVQNCEGLARTRPAWNFHWRIITVLLWQRSCGSVGERWWLFPDFQTLR